MVYTRAGIPIGDYNADRIVNLGDGHASFDNGLGYTYFNEFTGLEFSAVTGLTYNLIIPARIIRTVSTGTWTSRRRVSSTSNSLSVPSAMFSTS